MQALYNFDANLRKQLDDVEGIDFEGLKQWQSDQLHLDHIQFNTIEDFPILFDAREIITEVQEKSSFKRNSKKTTHQNIKLAIQHEEFEDMFNNLFKAVFIIKFRRKKISLLQNLREEISKAYLKVIVKIAQLDRETILIALEFYLGFLIHYTYHTLFVYNRELFQPRF